MRYMLVWMVAACLVAAAILVQGVALAISWGWFVAPTMNLPPLGWALGTGLMLLSSILFGKTYGRWVVVNATGTAHVPTLAPLHSIGASILFVLMGFFLHGYATSYIARLHQALPSTAQSGSFMSQAIDSVKGAL